MFDSGYALIVGVGDDLPCTVRDATAIRDLLCDPTRGGYSDSQVRFLAEGNSRRANVIEGLHWLAHCSAQAEDATAVVYFSGHGIAPEGHDAEFGLVCSREGAGRSRDDVLHGSLFSTLVANIRVRKLLVILDTCFADGQLRLKGEAAIKESPAPLPLLSELASGEGRIALSSSRASEYSSVGEPYSLFTAALLEAASGYARSADDGFARVFDIASYVCAKVPSRSREPQTPVMSAVSATNFPVCLYAGGAKRPAKLAWSDEALPDTGAVVRVDQIPPGPMVPFVLVPIELSSQAGDALPTEAKGFPVLLRAGQLLQRADPTARVIGLASLPSYASGAGAFWLSAFHEACLQGPRHLGALLLSLPMDRFPEATQRACTKLLGRLRLRNYRNDIGFESTDSG